MEALVPKGFRFAAAEAAVVVSVAEALPGVPSVVPGGGVTVAVFESVPVKAPSIVPLTV